MNKKENEEASNLIYMTVIATNRTPQKLVKRGNNETTSKQQFSQKHHHQENSSRSKQFKDFLQESTQKNVETNEHKFANLKQSQQNRPISILSIYGDINQTSMTKIEIICE